LTFYDSDGFDRDLSASLRSKPENVRIKVLGTMSVNKIPPRLGAWLNEVRKGGGKVAVQPDKDQTASDRSFSLLGGVIDGMLASISYIEQRNRYGPASYYDAHIYADTGSASITGVVFTAKETVQ
jgi:hypothetical protein